MATEKDTVSLTDDGKEAHASILRRFRVPVACISCALCTMGIFIGITVKTVRDSVPGVRPTAVAINATEELRGIRAIVDAELSHDANWHDVTVHESACQFHMICENSNSMRCPLFWVHIEDAKYLSPTQVRFILEATQVEPLLVQRMHHIDPVDVSVSCDLVVEVDVYRTGFRVVRDMSFSGDAQSLLSSLSASDSPSNSLHTSVDDFPNAANGSLSLSFELVHRNFTAPRLGNPVALVDSSYHMVVVAPQGTSTANRLVSILQNVTVTVQAEVAYNEKGGAFGMRAAADSVLQFYTDESGNVVLVLPLSLIGSTHFPRLAQTIGAAVVGLVPRSADNGTWHHEASISVEANAPESALAHIFGAQHKLSIVDDQKRGVVNASTHRRLNENVFGVEHHIRVTLDENPFIGIDYHLIDGSPLEFIAGLVVHSFPDPMDADRVNYYYGRSVSSDGEDRWDSGGGELSRSVAPYRELENSAVRVNVSAELDMEAETASIAMEMQQSGGEERFSLRETSAHEGDRVNGSMTAHPFELHREFSIQGVHLILAASVSIPDAVAEASITFSFNESRNETSSFLNKEYLTESENGWVASNRPNETRDQSEENVVLTFNVRADFDGDPVVAEDKGTMILRIDPNGLEGLDPIVLDITRTQVPDGEEEIFAATMTMGLEGDRNTQNNPFGRNQINECRDNQPERFLGENCTAERQCCAYFEDHLERCNQAQDWGFDAYAECCACGRSPRTQVEFHSGVNATGRVVINSGRRRSATSLRTTVTPVLSVLPYCHSRAGDGAQNLNLECTELKWDDDSGTWLFHNQSCCEETPTGFFHDLFGIDIGSEWTSPGVRVAELTEVVREDFEFMTHGHDFTLLVGINLTDADALRVAVDTTTSGEVMSMDIAVTQGEDTLVTADAAWTQNATGDAMTVMLQDGENAEVGTVTVGVNQAVADVWTMKGSLTEPDETNAAFDGFVTLDFSGESQMSAVGHVHENQSELMSFVDSLSDDDSTISVRSSLVFDHEEVESTEFNFVYGGSTMLSMDMTQQMDRDCHGEGAAKECRSQPNMIMHMDATHPDVLLENSADRELMLAQPFRMNMYLDIMEEEDEDQDRRLQDGYPNPSSCSNYFPDVMQGVITVVDPDVGLTNLSAPYCAMNNVSTPCIYMHLAGPANECQSPAPPDGCHRYHTVRYSECEALQNFNFSARIDTTGAFSTDGVFIACADRVISRNITCYGPPADSPGACECPPEANQLLTTTEAPIQSTIQGVNQSMNQGQNSPTPQEIAALSERWEAQVARRPQDVSPVPRSNMMRVMTTMMTFQQSANNMLEGGTFIYGGVVDNSNLSQHLELEMGMVFDSSSSSRMSMEMSMWDAEQDELMYASSDMDYEPNGNYMRGPLVMTMGEDSMTMDMRMSRGFLEVTTKPSGYDQLDVQANFDVGEEARIEMSAYLERGPDLAISGLGHAATISELQNLSGNIMPIPRIWQEMDFNFVPGSSGISQFVAPADGSSVVYTETVFATNLTMSSNDLALFNLADFAASVATSTGLDPNDVEVIGVTIAITVQYAFDNSVTVAQATTAVANANGVQQSQVQVRAVPSRRLAGGRRLAEVNYEVVITVEDQSKAVAVMASSVDTATLTSSLRAVAPNAPPPTVSQQPVAVVSVQTALRSSDGSTHSAPDNTQLEQAIEARMNIQVETESTVVSQSTTNCANGVCEAPELVAIAAAGTGQASHALGMIDCYPFVLFLTVTHLVAMFVA